MTRHANNPENPSKRGGDTSRFSSKNGGTWGPDLRIKENITREVIEYQEEVPEEDRIHMKDLYSQNGPYTPEQKLSAVMAYVVTGCSIKAGEMTGIPNATIRYWKSQAPWWPETIAKLRKQKQDELDGRFTGVIHKAIGEVEDRLDNGDQVVDKNGNLVRRKMSGKETATTLAILFDKRQMLRGDPTSRTEKTTTSEQLTSIMNEFQRLAADIKSRQEKDVISEEL
jgi:hypothetical protein